VIEFDSEQSNNQIEIPLIGFDSKTPVNLGYLIIPANTFPPGCKLNINSSQSHPKTATKDGCTVKAQQESAEFSLTLHGCGRVNTKKLRHYITIQLYARAQVIVKFNQVRLVYIHVFIGA
jgi:hypothetical protein